MVDAETRHVASAKHPKRWLSALACTAAYVREPDVDGDAAAVRISLPDGREVCSDDPACDEVLSSWFGRAVTLESSAAEGATYELSAMDAEGLDAAEPERLTEIGVGFFAPPGSFFDTSTLHVLTTQSLQAFAAEHPDGDWDRRRFRPNVLVDVPDGSGFVENAWTGRSLELGADVRAAVMVPMPRCVMTTLPQAGLPRDPLVLRTIAERNRLEYPDIPEFGVRACAGVMANVVAPGELSVGDPVVLGGAL